MLDHSDFAETDIPFEIPLPEKAYLTVSNHDIPFESPVPEKAYFTGSNHDIPFEIPVPEKAYLTVSNHDIPFEILLPEKRHPLSNLCQRKVKVHMHKKKNTCRKEKKM